MRRNLLRQAQQENENRRFGVDLELISMFAEASGRPVPHKVTPRRAGDIAASLADPAKAARLLNWTAKRDLRQMCASPWGWQSGNPDGYRGS